MALTNEEKKTVRAYNIGYSLSAHEPKLLEQIIRSNKNNDFVKVMAIAKEHHEFNVGIPQKEFSREYKNGFHNARALCENDPQLLDKMLSSKVNKDFLKGLKAGKKEYEVRQLTYKAKNEPKPITIQDKPDFTKGFSHGYLLSKQHPDIVKFTIDTQRRWSPYVQGLQAGEKQYIKDAQAKALNPPKGKEISDEAYISIRTKVEDLKENAESKLTQLDEPEIVDNPQPTDGLTSDRLPDWLKRDIAEKRNIPDKRDKNLGKDFEPEK